MKTAFVCDSTLQVNEEFCKNYPLSIVPLEVRLDDELYEDNVTITPEEFYKKINSGMKPSTSQPSVGKMCIRDRPNRCNTPMATGMPIIL